MDSKEFKEFEKILKSFHIEVTKTKEASQEFLFNAGIIKKNGDLNQIYKHLCIPDKED